MKKDVNSLNHDDLAKFYFESMKNRARMFKNGSISMSEYNSWVLRAYEGLKRLGLKDAEAKEIIADVERVA